VGGMRGLKAMLWEGSVLDPNEVFFYPSRLKLLRKLTRLSRAFVSTALVSPTVKSNCLLHPEERK
jgi:hypothetical protein